MPSETDPNVEHHWQAKPWLAALLNFGMPPLGFLYLGRGAFAAIFLIAYLAILCALKLFGTELLVTVVALLIQIACAVHAYLLARQVTRQHIRPRYSRWYALVTLSVVFFGTIAGFRAFVMEPFRPLSGSMLPTLDRGSLLIASKWRLGTYGTYGIQLSTNLDISRIKRGEIIVFRYPLAPEQSFVKRLIGLPGDVVVYENKLLSINGLPVTQEPAGDFVSGFDLYRVVTERLGEITYKVALQDEKTIQHPSSPFANSDACEFSPIGVRCTVPADNLFVLGDNRDNSADSRVWGFVPTEHFIGVVSHVF